MPNNYIPDGYHAITPSIVVRNASEAIEFYQRAFGATLRHRMDMPSGKVMHAEMEIAGTPFMLSDENPQWGSLSPLSLGGSAGALHIYVPDVDAAFQKAIDAGGTAVMPVTDQFWGDRSGYLTDPYGHRWGLATRKEDLSFEEMQRRGDEWIKTSGF